MAPVLVTARWAMRALYDGEEERLAEIVRPNRKGRPERVIGEVEKRAAAGFALAHHEP